MGGLGSDRGSTTAQRDVGGMMEGWRTGWKDVQGQRRRC